MSAEFDKPQNNSGNGKSPVDFHPEFWEETYPQLRNLAKDASLAGDLPTRFGSRDRIARDLGVESLRELAQKMGQKGSFVEVELADGWDQHAILNKTGISEALTVRIRSSDNHTSRPDAKLFYERDLITGDEEVETTYYTDGTRRDLNVVLITDYNSDESNSPGYRVEARQSSVADASSVELYGKETNGVIFLDGKYKQKSPPDASEDFFLILDGDNNE